MDYFTADQHFDHAGIIALCNRPWRTKHEMNHALIQLWNNTVAPEDRVFVLGDFAFGGSKTIAEFASSLNGYKILIMGNHDNHRVETYMKCGFSEVYPFGVPVTYDNMFILSHAPIHLPKNSRIYNVHGHLHNKEDQGPHAPYNLCISVEKTNYAPITINDIWLKFFQKSLDYVVRRVVEGEDAMHKERNSGRQS